MMLRRFVSLLLFASISVSSAEVLLADALADDGRVGTELVTGGGTAAADAAAGDPANGPDTDCACLCACACAGAQVVIVPALAPFETTSVESHVAVPAAERIPVLPRPQPHFRPPLA